VSAALASEYGDLEAGGEEGIQDGGTEVAGTL